MIELAFRKFYPNEVLSPYEKKYKIEVELFTIIGNRYIQHEGWAVVSKNNPYNIWCYITGKPGSWWLNYYHVGKGIQKEQILVPRTAKYRILQIIKDNPL